MAPETSFISWQEHSHGLYRSSSLAVCLLLKEGFWNFITPIGGAVAGGRALCCDPIQGGHNQPRSSEPGAELVCGARPKAFSLLELVANNWNSDHQPHPEAWPSRRGLSHRGRRDARRS